MKARLWVCVGAGLGALLLRAVEPLRPAERSLDPRGKVHIPIGLANAVDQLKTFVEAEGSFSPGFGSYGIYFWVWNEGTRKLTAPTMEGVECARGLGEGGGLIPWSKWQAEGVEIRSEVCQTQQRFQGVGEVQLVAARVTLRNTGASPKRVALYAALRPLGPAGWAVRKLEVAERRRDALLVEGHPAIVGETRASGAGVLPSDSIGELALRGEMPGHLVAESPAGDCSGALRYDLNLGPGQSRTIGFVCPVKPGRRVVGHQWDKVSAWAQLDLNAPNPPTGGAQVPDPGLAACRGFQTDRLFADARAYWKDLVGRCWLQLPDARWGESFAAIVGHCAMNMNEGAPDVAVANYNVFNRDGMYIANIFQKSGQFGLAAAAIDYFLDHPFNGRVQPEADNPGQILFVMGEHWRFTRDRAWLNRIYSSARKLAAMIRYYRTAPGPHWVCDTSLDFGETLPASQRKELKPGACDGFNPNYTEAYDIAGLRAAAALAEAIGHQREAAQWRQLAEDLWRAYDEKFGADLPKGYGSYSVLWPCRLYPVEAGKAQAQFRGLGAQRPTDWRYFPLARAHQGLLAGNRDAAWQTLAIHLDHAQMRGWYAFDEGGPSGVGGWHQVRTTWPVTPLPWDKRTKGTVAMPHGWAIAEFHLLLRDSLLFEDGDRLVLFAGVPPQWLTHSAGMRWQRLPTHFGASTVNYTARPGGAVLRLSGSARPPGGFHLRLPEELGAQVFVGARAVEPRPKGDVVLPVGTREATIRFGKAADAAK